MLAAVVSCMRGTLLHTQTSNTLPIESACQRSCCKETYSKGTNISNYVLFKFDTFVYVYANSSWKRNHVLIQSAISLSVLC